MDSKTEEIHVILDSLNTSDPGITHSALSMLVQKLRTSTSVASTIPKILLYLVSQKEVLQEKLLTLHGENRKLMSDIISVISATLPTTDSLKYRLEGGSTHIDIWGHQYIKKLSSDIVQTVKAANILENNTAVSACSKQSLSSIMSSTNSVEHSEKITSGEEECFIDISGGIPETLEKVIGEVVECLFKFNCECDCIDFLLEIDRIEMILSYIDTDNVDRIINYLNSLLYFISDEKTVKVFLELLKSNRRLEQYAKLMIKKGYVAELLEELRNVTKSEKIRIFYILGKHEVWNKIEKEPWDEFVRNMVAEMGTTEGVTPADILSNTYMAELNKYVSKKLELTKETTGDFGSFGDALSKASFSTESLPEPENKKTYKITSQCSKGLLYLWDQNKALSELEEHIFSEDGYLKVSSILALATATSKVYDYNDTVLAAITEGLDTKSVTQKIVLLISLIMKYSGSQKQEIFDIIHPLLYDESLEVSLFAVYAIGNIFSGSCNIEMYTELVQILGSTVGEDSSENSSGMIKFALLGVSLLFLQGMDKVTEILESCEVLEEFGTSLSILLRSMSYLGSGNTKVIHDILKDALDEESTSTSDYRQVFSVLGVALISLGDDTLVQMASHVLEGSMLLDSPKVQMAIPIAYSILYLSTGKTEIIDALRRCMHSTESSVVISAIISLGLVSAGSNNSRVRVALDEMATFCGKGATGSALKIAQGLLRLGKSMHKLSFFNDSAVSNKAVGAILGFMFGVMDGGAGILDRYYFVLMLISAGITPKYLVTLNEKGEPAECSIRVGNKLDTAGVSGKPKKLSGVQVHQSPVILQATEGAEVLGDRVTYHSDGGVVIVSAVEKVDEVE